MIGMLTVYFKSLRLSEVLEGVTFMGRRWFSIVREDLSIAFVCLESGDETNLFRAIASSYFGTGYS